MAFGEEIQRRVTILRNALSGVERRRGAVVLLYHRVGEGAHDPQGLCCTPARFAEQLAALRERFRLAALSELFPAPGRLRVKERRVVVTFDDGYLDNLTVAKPILEKHGVPATVFVMTGAAGASGAPWWDELERVFRPMREAPAPLEFDTPAGRVRWQIVPDGGAAAGGGRLPAADGARRLTAAEAYREAYRLLRPLPPEAVAAAMESLRRWAGGGGNGDREGGRILGREEIRRLAAGGLIDVGAHTRSHPLLAVLPAADQQREIAGSRADLEEILGRPVSFFAYPFGGLWDYSPRTVALVRQAGFRGACANFPGVVGRFTDPWQLPRVIVRDWDGDALLRRLRGGGGGVGP